MKTVSAVSVFNRNLFQILHARVQNIPLVCMDFTDCCQQIWPNIFIFDFVPPPQGFLPWVNRNSRISKASLRLSKRRNKSATTLYCNPCRLAGIFILHGHFLAVSSATFAFIINKTMTTKERVRLKALEQKDKQWNDFLSEYLRNTPFEKRTENDFEYDGLTNEELEEYNRLCHKRYWEWVLTDSEKEEARFKELQMMDDAWRRDLEERIEKQKDEPSDTPDHPNDETLEEYEARMARESQELHISLRHGMSENDWHAYQRLTRKRTLRLWLDFLGGNEDFGWEYLLQLLQFKIDRMVDYWRRSSHLANGDYIRRQMELASRLTDIVLKDGNDSGGYDKFPYRVNLRNKHRFSVRFHHNYYPHGEKQRVRFCKAYCLLFKLMQENLLHWWD